jgi:probable F420-dependent oxidoreductase
MQLNALFPTRDIGSDPAKIRDWAQAAEDLGFAHIEVADHVFGANARGDWKPIYNETDPFHETFTTLAFLAAVTKTIKLTSGVLILPQRQTGVVAKQAAEVDLLSGGRLRLGVGVGWNHVEYEALGAEWKTRGARQAEQIKVMRRLWTGDLVTFSGRFHELQSVNIVPPPVQRPIPVWFGGSSDAVVKRAALLGDGWMPIMAPDAEAEAKLEALRGHMRDNGRDPASFGLEGWLRMYEPDTELWASAAAGWRRLGAQMVMLYPMYRLPTFDEQINTLRRFKEVAGE